MSNIEPTGRRLVARPISASLTRSERRQVARLEGTVAAIEHRTIVRIANIQAEGFVATEKSREVDRLAHTAMSGQALLKGWANQLAGNDLGLIDDMRFFTDMAKLGKGEIIADAIDTFRFQ